MPQDAVRPRVLVVEDDPGILSLMLAILRRGGFETESVTNGIDAISVIARRPFVAVVLDLLLPRSSGFDVLEWLQNGYSSILPRVIILSATSPAIVRKHAVSHRVFRIMQKPFDIEELLDVVNACASRERGPFLGVGERSYRAKADAAVVGLVAPEHDALQLVWSFGYDEATLTKYNPLPLSMKAPLSTAVVEARPVWVHSRRELAEAFPSVEASDELRAVAAVPIVDHGAVAGSIGWRFTEEQPFDDGQQQLLLSIAADCLPLPKSLP
ncbi:MAG TPA: response regulator [Thermoanaerobaculia bacterium]|jgi:DNA-binding response OmpR family regulator